ncbi:aminoglycoside phosphotransferase family protein [Pseudalkalibacillus berkeleyi]|uniref:Aminoglycoside phosphotransferase family protein n=1 Tax=Pseudalkalibacillus berkeleyi TaxID=1069813 RepID=A0ABS9GYB6_9BACL|nr:aminoglycoside phosphotransferase family protein [Pseudalkalibacillus berkeleyi]MCF6136493.1 aminoglycoside phosphotransferase family protein [Pseudalkalibacillus berkeleyi]
MDWQENFKKNIHLYFGEVGDAWLENLPKLIKYCEVKWSLAMNEPYSLSINYVAPAEMEDGRDVVIKICIPGNDFLDEVEALKLFRDKGMVKLIDYDINNGILILEKLLPGFTLAKVEDQDEACGIAAREMKKLITPAPKDSRLPTTKAREQNLRKQVDDHPYGVGQIDRATMDRALRIFTYLNDTIEHKYLLHGDFHHYNILSSGVEEWTVIDPKGLIGEIEYDLIQFMLNKLPEEDAYKVIKRRCDIFTEELNLNKERLLLWGYCHTVLATVWSVDMKDGSYNKSFLKGIRIFENLYESEFGKKQDPTSR